MASSATTAWDFQRPRRARTPGPTRATRSDDRMGLVPQARPSVDAGQVIDAMQAELQALRDQWTAGRVSENDILSNLEHYAAWMRYLQEENAHLHAVVADLRDRLHHAPPPRAPIDLSPAVDHLWGALHALDSTATAAPRQYRRRTEVPVSPYMQSYYLSDGGGGGGWY